MKKIDVKKEFKELYGVSNGEPARVDVPPMTYLMVDGIGDPNTSMEYAEAVEALFAVSYAVKFAVKRGGLAIDYGVMPLDGLWWADDISKHHEIYLSDLRRADPTKWKTIIRQPFV